MKTVRGRALDVYAILAIGYMLLPIAVVILFSFNNPAGRFNYVWQSFTFDNWIHWDAVPGLRSALETSLLIAVLASVTATALGTLIALALVRHQFRGRAPINFLIFLPMAAPEIVLGASLLTLFLNQALLDLGFWTIFIAHVMFCISFVVVTVRARLVDFDRHLEEAAADLGATGLATFRLVTLPLLWPAILAGGLLGLRHLRRRLRHHLLQLRQRDHVPRLRLGPGRPGSPAAGQRDRLCDLPRRCRDHARQRHRPDPPPEGNRRMTPAAAADLQQAARDHLWMHFTRMSGYASNEVPIIVRGDGCYLEDSNGKRYLDALAGLFSVNIGYGFGDEIGQAALAQMKELPFYTNWSYAHPRAIELASELASLAPGDLNRAFFVSGGSEAVESAWKLARQYFLARGGKRIEGADETRHDERVGAPPPRKYKAIARQVAYHGTTMGALSINGIPALRMPFEPLVPEVRHVMNTNRYHRPPEETEAEFTQVLLANLEDTIVSMGPETVCLIHMEPVQNAGGAFTPPAGYWQGVRELCDRYDILLSADEVITAFGRVGHWFASERYDIRPDIVCCAKGLSSSYAAIGAVIASDKVTAPFLEDASMYAHGITFGGHPVMSAIALKNIEIMKRERIMERVLENEGAFRATLETLLELPIVGDVRGTGYFYAIELVKDKETRETFSAEECETLLRGFLSPALFERGLICRADDRGDPVIQISPPLVAGQAEFDEMVGILGDVLAEAGTRMHAA